jgi:hypothetical protein
MIWAIPKSHGKVHLLLIFYLSLYHSKQDTLKKVGLSAQEVEKILPEVVAPAPIGQGYLTVKYEKLIPLLVEAIKEQQTMIEQLVKKINTLEERLNDK